MKRYPYFIYLYNGAMTESLDLGKVALYLRGIFKTDNIEIRDEFVKHSLSNLSIEEKEKTINDLAKEITETKVRDLNNQNKVFEPLWGEIEYEKNRISNPGKKSLGVLYDGFKLANIFCGLINPKEYSFNYCHIIFTNQLFGTWDEDDLRYHARVSIYGFPSIISTSGIVEAPAKPRDFYLKRQFGMNVYALKEMFKNRFIDYDDPRLTEVMKGYTLQSLVHHITGYPFCENKNCRLYNAHWQEEVIWAQLQNSAEFCHKHREFIDKIRIS